MTKTATAKLRKKAEQTARAKQDRLARENQERADRLKQERADRLKQERADRLNQEKVLREDQGRALTLIEVAADNARKRGVLSEQAYKELIDAGLNDMRKDHVQKWTDAVVMSGITEPKPVHAHRNVASPITVSTAESIVSRTMPHTEEAPAVEECVPEETPSSPVKMYSPSACPPPESERQNDGEYVDDSSLSSFTFPEDDPPAEEATDVASPEARQKPLIPDGSAFLHCSGCLRVDVVEYADRMLPAYLRSPVGSLLKTVVMILCGTCREDPHFASASTTMLEDSNATSWSRLRFRPESFEESAPMQAIRHLVGGDVSILTMSGGILYRQVDRIVRSLRPDDRMASIDVVAFRRGERAHLKLHYLRGGLISSAEDTP